MAAANPTANDVKTQELRAAADGWWLILLWGVLGIIVGVIMLQAPVRSALALFTIFGIYFLVAGFVDIIASIAQRGPGWGWKLALGVLYVVAGFAVLNNTALTGIFTLQVLYFFIAFAAIFGGIMNIIQAVMRIGKAGFWPVLGILLLGIFQLVIGFALLENPAGGTIALWWVLAIFAIAGGIVLVIQSFMVRSMGKKLAAGQPVG
jgi:uncharacterized membrane protein HdeD (DUF308 family)